MTAPATPHDPSLATGHPPSSALAADGLPTRVLLLGDAWPGNGSNDAPMHWICAHLHQNDPTALVRTAQANKAEALLLHVTDTQALEAWLDTLAAVQKDRTDSADGPRHPDQTPHKLQTGQTPQTPQTAPSTSIADPEPPGARWRWPVVCLSSDAPPAQQQRALALGVEVWLESPAHPDTVRRQLRWACWRAHAEATALATVRERLQAQAQAQLDDRKWTERAKGLLMNARDLDEGSAFRLLRETAMHAHLKLGEVARSVVQSAQRAEAVNLAGQQRMLSQRLVKLMAQRAAGIEIKRAKALQDDSCERVSANLARLPTLLPTEVDPAPLNAAWERLHRCLHGRPDAALLLEADAAAQALLEMSDRLTAAIAAGGAGRPLHIVNLCGRQRMLSQRLAKEALLADLLPQRDAAVLADSLDQFAAGLVELEASPLSSEAIRGLLAEVGAEWLRLMRSLRDTHGKEAATGLARSSEVLLHQLDLLTGHYQQSLQLILG